VRFERFPVESVVMAGALAQDTAEHPGAALDDALRGSPELPATARAAFGHLIDVLEANADAFIFPADATVSTQQAAELLGASRMTVVRLVDRGELAAEGGAVHRPSRCPRLPATSPRAAVNAATRSPTSPLTSTRTRRQTK
jgi:hypothetical protein